MTPFWRANPLSEQERTLLGAMLEAHHRSAFRENISTVTLINAGVGSGSYTNALAAALLTLGGVHAPLMDTYQLLTSASPGRQARLFLEAGKKVPGWGNSFTADPDPVWSQVDSCLKQDFPTMAEAMERVTAVLHCSGKKIHPNPSAYTAATAIVLAMPAEICPWIFVSGRLAGWSEIYLKGRA